MLSKLLACYLIQDIASWPGFISYVTKLEISNLQVSIDDILL